MAEFVPDLVINIDSELFQHCDAFLNSSQLARCFEARITFESFERPAFGELIVGADDGGHTYQRPPRLGEFEINSLWCKFVCGKVFIQLDERGKEILAVIRPILEAANA